jgi:hypothetical protein
MNEVKDYFRTQFLENLKNKDLIQHTFILQSTTPNYLLLISFASTGKIDINLENDFFAKQYKSVVNAVTTTLNFQIIAINQENYFAKIGDKMILWDYHVKNKKKEDVINHFKNIVYPLLAKDEFTRDSYLIAQKNLNIFVGITMLSGKYKESKVVSEKLKEINKYLDKPPKLKVYDIIGVYDK